jgi:hypothetical protein
LRVFIADAGLIAFEMVVLHRHKADGYVADFATNPIFKRTPTVLVSNEFRRALKVTKGGLLATIDVLKILIAQFHHSRLESNSSVGRNRRCSQVRRPVQFGAEPWILVLAKLSDLNRCQRFRRLLCKRVADRTGALKSGEMHPLTARGRTIGLVRFGASNRVAFKNANLFVWPEPDWPLAKALAPSCLTLLKLIYVLRQTSVLQTNLTAAVIWSICFYASGLPFRKEKLEPPSSSRYFTRNVT